ncbi:hypothetical protein NDU88_002215 [Pleurodeles waltl]|uniref:Uncharacterized protein n=1 Tax=Pleurodeles waltl TaxID=8319 RepID=A0AAV7UY98_PLEWA|nr:hypothetical protein NDU88_002215 [Pleurodeles waltl]
MSVFSVDDDVVMDGLANYKVIIEISRAVDNTVGIVEVVIVDVDILTVKGAVNNCVSEFVIDIHVLREGPEVDFFMSA